MDESMILQQARTIYESRMTDNSLLILPDTVEDYLRLTIGMKEHEVFQVLFLDTQSRLIASEEMFRGTLTQTPVYAREVLKRALHHNAAAVVLAHNHPSGEAEPSDNDILTTQRIIVALKCVDIEVHDHFVVGGRDITSMRKRGMLDAPDPETIAQHLKELIERYLKKE